MAAFLKTAPWKIKASRRRFPRVQRDSDLQHAEKEAVGCQDFLVGKLVVAPDPGNMKTAMAMRLTTTTTTTRSGGSVVVRA